MAYVIERFPTRVFVPAIGLHAAVAWWAVESLDADLGADGSWAPLARATGLMTLLFLQFRLWDDLQDADRDRMAHPQRVLAHSARAPFRVLLIGLAGLGAVAFAARSETLAAFLVLNGACWMAYRAVRPRVADSVWRYGCLLLKYPAFVWLVAATIGRPAPARLGAASIAAYLGTCLYETWHHDFRRQAGVAS